MLFNVFNVFVINNVLSVCVESCIMGRMDVRGSTMLWWRSLPKVSDDIGWVRSEEDGGQTPSRRRATGLAWC